MKLKSFSYLLLVFVLLLAACDSQLPTPPPIVINITAVENSTALAQAIDEALVATEQANAHLTETVIANNGMTLTPSSTPTITPTPTISPTRPITATPTLTPSTTFTPTYNPILTNTPAAVTNPSFGWIRFLNSWVNPNGQTSKTPVDVFINEERVARSVAYGEHTNYYQVAPGAVRITLGAVDAQSSTSIATTVVNVAAGGVVSVLALDLGEGMELYPVPEDVSPLAVGASRLTIVQANPGLQAVNIDAPNKRLRLASNLKIGDIIGPLEVPAGELTIDLNRVSAINVNTIASLPFDLTGQVSHILILLPPASQATGLVTTALLQTGLTGRIKSDIGIRIVNALPNIGNLQLIVGQTVVNNLAVGNISPSIPIPVLGTSLILVAQSENTNNIGSNLLGPYTKETEATSDKILLLLPSAPQADTPYTPVTFAQNAPRSAINANIRLIHGFPGAVPLNLQIKPIRPAGVDANGQPQEAPGWASIGQAEYATASAYFSRSPEVYAVRVVQAGSQTVLAELPPQQFLAGGVYDFVVTPGVQTGSAQLLMVEPTVQITQLVQGSGNPTAVYEAVSGTLTALAPVQVAVTITQTFTPTPSRTPIPTNTPRPTNTPEYRLPLLLVNPAPPQTTLNTINLVGENFQPKLQYAITLDSSNAPILIGQINDDGTLLASISLPENLSIGIHSLRVCVDCRARGLQQAAYAQFIIADPRVTPTATAQP